MNWDARQYRQFERERTQPAIDLANRVRCNTPHRVLDLGCGPGNSTEVLHQRFPKAQILGVDNSPEMIAEAEKTYPGRNFRLFDATAPLTGLGERFDLIFANASIQWVPDHRQLIPRLLAGLAPGGELAIQIPLQGRTLFHRLIGELSQQPRWRERLAGARVYHLLEPEEYYDLLAAATPAFELWETTYYHRIPSLAALLDWYRGTGLRPFLQKLPEAERGDFEAALTAALEPHFPVRPDGSIILRFERLFMIAERS